MTKRRFCFMFFLLICFSLPLTTTAQTVNIADDNLRAAIWNELGTLPEDIPIPVSDMATLTQLTAPRANITNLTGLEHATNLTELYLEFNSISDISPLAGLNNLTDLDLRNNLISDISPLAENTGLGRGDMVGVSENPLNHASITVHIPALRRRGVEIYWFDNIVAQPVNILDSNLRAAVENALGVASGATIVEPEMEILTVLEAPNANITDLTGLEYATNLTELNLANNSISDISPLAGLNNLTRLELWNNAISDISPLTGLNSLTWLVLAENAIPDISPLEELTNLTELYLGGNSISDTSPVEGLTQLTRLDLESNAISDISAVAGLTNLTALFLEENVISNISPLAGLTNLTYLELWDNAISDISPLANLTKLTNLQLLRNAISDISPLANLTSLENLSLSRNAISDISPLAGLTNLTGLSLGENAIFDISPLAGLTNLTYLELWDNSISDISPLVENTGLGSGDFVDVGKNPLNYASINTHIPALQRRGVEVRADNLKPTTSEYTLTMPAGISLIHFPLRVLTIGRISDLYDALGGASTVNFLITYDSQAQEWRSYFGPSDKGGPADSGLTDDMGIIVGLKVPVSIHLRGTALGTDGNSTISLNQGLNVVGLPLNDSRINRVSDLFDLNGIGGNVPVIILTDGGEFKLVGRAGDPGDIEITGGQAFIMTASQAATIEISGDAWTNGSGVTSR